MNIKFIYLDLNRDLNWIGCYYEGIGSVMTVLKQAGHKVSLLQATKLLSREQIYEFLGNDTELAAFSTTTNMFPVVKRWATFIKERFPDLPLLCGGNHPTLAPVDTLKESSSLDWCCVGEGEGFVMDLCDAIEGKRLLEDISNLAYRNGSEVVVNPLRPLIEDIDSLPIVDRSLFSEEIFKCPALNIHTSRGCPFECTFCCNKAKKAVFPNKSKYLRFHTPERVMEEIQGAVKLNPKICSIEIVDDAFAINFDWLNKFRELYKRHVNLPFICGAHQNYLSPEKIELLADMGCTRISMGLQCGDDYIRNVIMKRRISLQKLKEVVSVCKKFGIRTELEVLFGVPTETQEKRIHSLEVLANMGADETKAQIFYPYPYTELERLSKEMGLLNDNVFIEDIHAGTILNFSKEEKKRILFMKLYAQRLVSILISINRFNSFVKIPIKLIFFKIVFSNIFIASIVICRDFFLKMRSAIRKKYGIKEFSFKEI